ncbi:MAG: hypothetical protein LBH15_05260, partial [Treponema sp.]|nr:hypothetical protein [Treponema sp.]
MGKKRVIIPVSVFLVLAALWFGVSSFLSRVPVLVVEDRAFEAIYGPLRLRKARLLLSLKLERPLRVVLIEENAGDDVAVFAVESAAETPFCVIFAARYYNAARRYSREHPEVPAGVFRGRSQDFGPAGGEGFKVIGTDQKLDLYRAGRLTALLASPPPPSEEDAAPEERIPAVLVFQDEYISNEQRDAFKQGLEDEGCQSRPRYLIGSSQYQSGMPCDAAVVYGAAPGFSEMPGEIPGVLFSWLDPALTPLRVKAVFDD